MDEQLLKDLVATSRANNYNWDIILPKFPELTNYDSQLLKDYVATSEADQYNWEVINKKFPEFEFEGVEVSKETEPEKEEDLSFKIQKAKDFDKGIFKIVEREAYNKYKETGEIDLELFPEEKKEVGFIEDKLARLSRGILSTAKGANEFKSSLLTYGVDKAIDIFSPDMFGSQEDKNKALQTVKQVSDIAQGTNFLEKGIIELGNNVREYDSESITDDISKAIETKDFSYLAQAADRAIGGVFESAPSLALAFLGPGGLIALGSSSAGNKFEEEFENNPEEGLDRIFLNSLLTGTAEATFELATRGILSRAKLLKNSGNTQAANDLISNYSTNLIKRFATDPLAEGVSEAATEFTTDLIDIATFDKDELPNLFTESNFKKWADAGIIGTVTGAGIVSTGALKSNKQSIKDAAEYTLMPSSDKKIINDAAININKLNQQIKESNDQNDIAVLEAEIINQEKEIIDTKIKVSEELNMMKPDELKSYAENIDKINDLKKRERSKSPFVKKVSAQDLVNLQLENEALIRESVDRRLDENIKAVGVKDLGRTVNDYNTKQEYQRAYDNTEVGKKNSMNVTSSDGFIDTEGDIYINKEVALKVRNVNVAAHELLHGILNNNIKEPGQLKKLVEEFKAILPRESADLIQKRIDDNYRFETNEKGERVELPESEYMEEYFTAFADLIGNKKIKFNENIFTNIGEKLTPIFKGKGYGAIKFETGQDVYDFIKNYQKQIAKGELSPETIEAGRKTTDEADVAKFSKKAGETINKVVGDVKTPSEVQAKVYEKLLAADAPVEVANLIDNVIKQQLKREGVNIEGPDANIYNQPLGEFIQQVKDQLLDKSVMRFDDTKAVKKPDGSYDVGGYLISELVRYRIGDVLKKYKPRAGQKSIDVSDAEGRVMQYEDVGAESEVTDIDLTKNKQPVNLRRALDIEEGGELYNKVKEVVSKTFGTRVPEVTDTKFKKTLQDTYSTELTNDVKELMGKPSSEKYKTFLQEYGEQIYDLLPQDILNKSYQDFIVEEKKNLSPTEVDKAISDGLLPGDTPRTSGPSLFTKKPFNQQEWVDYHLAPTKGRPASKQTQLAQTIAKELGKDATLEVLEDPKVFERFTAVEEIQGREVTKETKPKIADKIKREPGVKFSKTKDFRDITKGLSDVQIAQEISAVNKIAEDLGVSTEDVLLNIKDNISKYNKLRKELKIKEGGAKNISSKDNYLDLAQTYKSFIKNSIPKGKTFDDLPIPVQQAIIDTVGFGDTRITIGGTPLTFKAMTKGVKGYSNLLKTAFGEDVLIGTGKKLKNINAIFAPRNWGVFRKQVEKIVLQEGITPEQAKVEVEDLLRSKSKSETGENYTIDETLAANRNLLNAGYSSLIDLIVENKNKKTLGFVTDLLEAQVNRATGIFKGMVPMTSFNMKPEKGNTKNQNKLMHNEHLLELFNANKDFLKLANSFIEGKISEQEFRSKTIKNVNKLQQAVISERMRAQKDASGASVRDFVDPLTFLGKDAVDQIPIGSLKLESGDDFTGLNMAQFIVENLSNVQIQKLAKTVRGSLSAEGIMVKSILDNYKDYLKLKKSNIDNLSNNVVTFSKTDTNQDIIGYAKTVDEALAIARNPDAPVKKIRVFDFDDTLATTKSDVLFTAPDGTKGKLNAEEFAKNGSRLLEEGYVFDFSEFNKVTDGKPGPLLDIAKKIQEARGTEDVFVLTARAPEAQVAIKEFLDSVGLNIPLENITGLGNSTGAAKAKWIVDKAAKGYNDFYFADDAYQNVKAVQDALDQIDVKSKVQQAKLKFSKNVNEDFNKIIEQTTGIASEKRYSKAKAKVRGAGKGNKKFFIPYSAEDFMGLIYPLLSKGKLGDSQMAWFKEHLLDPYGRAMENVSRSRINLLQDFKALKKALEIPKNLRKKNDSGFTNEQAVRVYLFNKTGNPAPGLSKTDTQELLDVVNSDGLLKAFADEILNLTKGDGYSKPGSDWLAGTITTDLLDVLNNTKRAKYLEQSGFKQNAELIFNEENLNKLEAAYGEKYRDAMENVLKRMDSGKNRIFSGNRLSNRVLDYINGSIGTIMFFNTRSAVLQTISNINFLNWSFNNPIKAGKAFANQKQYWKDFKDLMNSDYLVDRRNGLKLNINENEIADAAATSKNKAKAAMSYILQKGFLPTQFADSFAIASGGATFYRNRINDLVKNQGMSEADAKKQAMLEFRQVAETSQQSSDPSKISAQQASDLGRVILAFANTPMQYARIQKRAIQDLVNRRGDAKTNVSKIIYYGVVQNLIFNALQQALFALGAGDDEDEMSNKEKEKYEKTKQKKYIDIANGMLDSQLRGLGIAGASASVVKNFLLDVYERSDRKRPEYVDAVYKLIQISPPISSKISKVRQAAYQFDSKKRREEIFDKGFSIDNPAYEAASKVISATTNLPLDRLYNKANNIEAALAEDTEAWQTIAMLAGWPEWQIKPDSKKSSSSKSIELKTKNKDKKSSSIQEVKELQPVIMLK